MPDLETARERCCRSDSVRVYGKGGIFPCLQLASYCCRLTYGEGGCGR